MEPSTYVIWHLGLYGLALIPYLYIVSHFKAKVEMVSAETKIVPTKGLASW